ncbi:MAG: hypothetical protein ACYDB5_10970 [bacterium]
MITTYSSYIQRLDPESLKQYISSGDSFTTVVLKEILDNALDAAEKAGDNTIVITDSCRKAPCFSYGDIRQ